MRIVTLLLFLLITLPSFGQNPKIEKARNLVLAGKGSKAINLLKKTYNKSEDIEIGREIVSIYHSYDLKNATIWAEKIGLNKSSNSEDVYEYAKILKDQGLYQKALEHCLKYSFQNNQSKSISELTNALDILIKKNKESVRFEIVTVPFNTSMNEIYITNFRNNYVMSSNGGKIFLNDETINSNFNFYLLQQEFNRWLYPTPLVREADNQNNRTTICYSYNGNEVYYTSNPIKTLSKKKKNLDVAPKFYLHHAFTLGDRWVEDSLLSFQVETFNYKDPALNPDENMLVFSSDMNNNGNYDLYYITKVDNKWSLPINLGNLVNTEFEERMPYFNTAGTLYFSSNNKNGFGGYDIYQTKFEDGIWILPEILPPPINSISDDIEIIFNHYGNDGFIVSNRTKSVGGFDVFGFKDFNLELSVHVLDNDLGHLLSYAEVQLYRDNELIVEKLTSDKGYTNLSINPNLNYTLRILKEGYLPLERVVNTKEKVSGTILYENIRLIKKTKEGEEQLQFDAKKAIPFRAKFQDNNQLELLNFPIRLVNLTQRKIKELNTGENGEVEQLLYPDNTYQFVIEYNNETIIKEFSVQNSEKQSSKPQIFTIP